MNEEQTLYVYIANLVVPLQLCNRCNFVSRGINHVILKLGIQRIFLLSILQEYIISITSHAMN